MKQKTGSNRQLETIKMLFYKARKQGIQEYLTNYL